MATTESPTDSTLPSHRRRAHAPAAPAPAVDDPGSRRGRLSRALLLSHRRTLPVDRRCLRAGRARGDQHQRRGPGRRSSPCTTTSRCGAAICCSASTMRRSASPCDEAEAQLAAATLQVDSLKANYRQRSSQTTRRRARRSRSSRASCDGSASSCPRASPRRRRSIAATHALDDARGAPGHRPAGDRRGAGTARRRSRTSRPRSIRRCSRRRPRSIARDSIFPIRAIHAPGDGVVTRVERCRSAITSAAHTRVFALVSTGDVWIEANFKEDQLAHMRAGQPASIKIDSYPGQTLSRARWRA